MSDTKLPRILNRAATQILRDDLIDAIGADPMDGPHTIDASAVDQMSHCALQLLVSAAKTGAGVQVKSASDPFSKAAKLAGLDAVLLGGE